VNAPACYVEHTMTVLVKLTMELQFPLRRLMSYIYIYVVC
jgi:hypothetical protein